MSKKEDIAEEIPEKFYDATTGTTYRKLRFFGKVNPAPISFIYSQISITLNWSRF